ARNTVDQIFGGADSHQVARFVLGQKRSDYIERVMHLLFGLTYRESTDSNTGRIERCDKGSGSGSKVRLNATLDDPEKGLVAASLGSETNFGPAVSPLHSELAVFVVVGIRTFIEGHNDIRAEVFLNSNGTL